MKKKTLTPTAQAARLMDNGDMLGPSMTLWKGRTYAPMPGDSEQTLRYKAERAGAFTRDLQQGFVPAENMVHSIISNVCDNVLASQPTWNTSGGTAAIRRSAEAIWTACWDKRDVHPTLQVALRHRVREGEGAVRLRIPPGALVQVGKVRKPRSSDPLTIAGQYLRVEHLAEPERLRVWEDEDTLTMCGEYRLEEGKLERYRIDEQGFTLCELVEGDQVTVLWQLNLGGRLPVIAISGQALPTQGILDNQCGANLITTSAIANSALAGQLMEHFHNMLPQRGPARIDPRTGEEVQGEPLPAIRGPGGELYTQDMIAVQEVDGPDGVEEKPVILKGSYTRHGPVSSEALEFNLRVCERNIYAEANQRHYLLGDKATTTGEARKTAMLAFHKSLAPYRRDAVRLMRETLETILALVDALAGTPGRHAAVRVEPQLTDRLAEPTAEDRKQDTAEVKDGVISLQTARARQGLDSESEQKQIDLERAQQAPPEPEPPEEKPEGDAEPGEEEEAA